MTFAFSGFSTDAKLHGENGCNLMTGNGVLPMPTIREVLERARELCAKDSRHREVAGLPPPRHDKVIYTNLGPDQNRPSLLLERSDHGVHR